MRMSDGSTGTRPRVAAVEAVDDTLPPKPFDSPAL
jgi:hypothetical protein